MTQASELAPGERLSDVVRRLGTAQKSNRGAAAYSRWINRPMGRWAAAVAYRAGWTPNQVTAASAALTFAGIGLLALLEPSVWSGFVVAGLLVAGYALDAADGQLARLTGTSNLAGEWLDHVVDALKNAALHAAVLIAWYRFFDVSDALLLVPLGYGIQASVFFFAIILAEQLRRNRITTPGASAQGRPHAPVLPSLVKLPTDYGLLCLVFCLWSWQPLFVGVYCMLFLVNLVALFLALGRWFREMTSLSAEAVRPTSS